MYTNAGIDGRLLNISLYMFGLFFDQHDTLDKSDKHTSPRITPIQTSKPSSIRYETNVADQSTYASRSDGDILVVMKLAREIWRYIGEWFSRVYKRRISGLRAVRVGGHDR